MASLKSSVLATSALAISALALSAACDAPAKNSEVMYEFPQAYVHKLDLLFVVDPTSATHRDQSMALIRRTIEDLDRVEGGRPDLQVAVVSSVLETSGGAECSGQGDFVPSCGGPSVLIDSELPDWLCDEAADCRMKNFEGRIDDELQCMVPPTSECEFSQPLEAMRRALTNGPLGDTPFPRDNALLAVVFITGQDDCSADEAFFTEGSVPFQCAEASIICDGAPISPQAGTYSDCVLAEESSLTPVSSYVEFLRDLKGNQEHFVVGVSSAGFDGAVEVAATNISEFELAAACNAKPARATPSPRLQNLAQRLAPYSHQSSFCDEETDVVPVVVGELFAMTLARRCLDGVRLTDTAPQDPGLQPDCRVTAGANEEVAIVPCTMSTAEQRSPTTPLPCWWVESPENTACMDAAVPHVEWPADAGPVVGPVTWTCAKLDEFATPKNTSY